MQHRSPREGKPYQRVGVFAHLEGTSSSNKVRKYTLNGLVAMMARAIAPLQVAAYEWIHVGGEFRTEQSQWMLQGKEDELNGEACI